MEDLNALTFDFLSKLPTSIRAEILVFVLLYAFDYSPLNEQSAPNSDAMPDVLKEYLCADTIKGGLRKFGALLKTVAATDHVLHRSISILKLNERRLPEMQAMLGDDKLTGVLERMRVGREFSLAHTEQALKTWNGLRSNQLSTEWLIAYEDHCLRPPRD